MIQERIVGRTEDGEDIYYGSRPAEPGKGWHYTKESRGGRVVRVQISELELERLIQNDYKEESGVPVCAVCNREGHMAHDCHFRGGTERAR